MFGRLRVGCLLSVPHSSLKVEKHHKTHIFPNFCDLNLFAPGWRRGPYPPPKRVRGASVHLNRNQEKHSRTIGSSNIRKKWKITSLKHMHMGGVFWRLARETGRWAE